MNYHIFPDDKYVMSFIEVAEKVGIKGGNLYLVRDPKPYRYLPEDNKLLVDAPVGSNTFNDIMSKPGQGDRIFLHFISGHIRNWLADFETDAEINWVYWGNDFYTVLLPKNEDHFDTLTQQLLNRNKPRLSRFYVLHIWREYRAKLKRNKRLEQAAEISKRAAAKINAVYHFMQKDAELIKQHLNPDIKFRYFNYPQPA